MLTVALLLTGCDRKTVYSHYEPTTTDGWEKCDSLTYTIAPLPEEGRYEETIGLRINCRYPFTGLSLVIDQHIFPSGRHYVDTLHAKLIDSDGTIQGQGISYFQYNFLLRQLSLQADDSLHVCIRHLMKREILPGVSDIGFSLTRQDS